jgi:hypothetical protein
MALNGPEKGAGPTWIKLGEADMDTALTGPEQGAGPTWIKLGEADRDMALTGPKGLALLG